MKCSPAVIYAQGYVMWIIYLLDMCSVTAIDESVIRILHSYWFKFFFFLPKRQNLIKIQLCLLCSTTMTQFRIFLEFDVLISKQFFSGECLCYFPQSFRMILDKWKILRKIYSHWIISLGFGLTKNRFPFVHICCTHFFNLAIIIIIII